MKHQTIAQRTAETQKSAPAKAHALQSIEVLIVEDEEITAEVTASALAQLGAAAIQTAKNGAEALNFMGTDGNNLGLILCDLNMPEMDGLEFLRHVADIECKTPIVLVSGNDTELLNTSERLARVHDLNLLGSISKPITKDKLTGLIALIDRQKGQAPCDQDGAGCDYTARDLKAAIRDNELFVVYQPKVSLSEQRVVSTEALVRWKRSDGTIVPPGLFIPLAEKWGLIDEVTDFVLQQAIHDCGRWHDAGQNWTVAINLSMDCLHQLSLPEVIGGYAMEAGIDPGAVCLEVTETRLTEDLARTLEILLRLRMRGMRLSIDDFGTGYSSFQQLHGIPFQELKIDRAFVDGAARDEKARAILETSISLGRKLGLKLVAEGVENDEDLALVERLGCDLVQGYYFSPPVTFLQLLATAKRIPDAWPRTHSSTAFPH